MSAEKTFYTVMDSPIGPLVLAANGTGLSHIRFENGKGFEGPNPDWIRNDETLTKAVSQLTEYFEKTRREFDLKLAPAGTPFQLKVWHALTTIPYGQTISYGELAKRVDKPTASRAVGAANGKNPLPIVLPCHRVIGSDGSLTGYGGGLPIKKALLELEGVNCAPEAEQLTLIDG